MKQIIVFIIMLFALRTGYGQQTLEAAKQKARQENKLILINFSGSDWCIPCIQMQKEFFEDSNFIRMADQRLVIIRADFPRKKKNIPSTEIVAQNELLADKFNPNGNFPFTLLIDANEKIIKRWDGKPDEPATTFSNNILLLADQNKHL